VQAPCLARQARSALPRRAIGRALEALVPQPPLPPFATSKVCPAFVRSPASRPCPRRSRPFRPASARRDPRRPGRCSPGRHRARRSARERCAGRGKSTSVLMPCWARSHTLPPAPPSPPSGTPKGHELLAAKADRAAAPVAGPHFYGRFIDEFHGLLPP
jgi:hypothetical protein